MSSRAMRTAWPPQTSPGPLSGGTACRSNSLNSRWIQDDVRQLGRGRQAPVPRAVEVDAVLLPQELVSNMLEVVEHDGGVVDDARPPETA